VALRLVPAAHPSADLEIVAALIGTLLLLGLWALPLDDLALFAGACQFKSWTGWPCGTCGITRAIQAVHHGQFGRALRLNPLLVVLLAVGAGYTPIAWVLWLKRAPRPRLGLPTRGARIGLLLVAVGLFVLNWAFLIGDGR
jgi:uncharacterized iron-regulated membrane protein